MSADTCCSVSDNFMLCMQIKSQLLFMQVLLMDDANYPCWLVLVPRRNGLREVIDLPPELQQQMWQEVAVASQAVQVGAP